MTGFRLALLTAVCVASSAAAIPTAAQAAIEYPWCACMETARGAGASCEVNLFYLDQQAKQKQQPHKRPTHN